MSDAYGKLIDAVPSELERLRLLERSADPTTIGAFKRIGVGPGWRCLEVGAGAGSIAGWLADRAGPASVVATDLNTEFLTGLADRGVRVLKHDVTTDPPPGDGFDLIHTRHLLIHLPERQQVLARFVSWLRPGGWLVVEDAHVSLELINNPAIRAARAGTMRLLSDRVGSDFTAWAATLPLPLEDVGLVDAEVRATIVPVRGGTMLARFGQLGLERMTPQLIEANILTADEIAAAHAAFADPRFLDYSHALICATARRPVRPD